MAERITTLEQGGALSPLRRPPSGEAKLAAVSSRPSDVKARQGIQASEARLSQDGRLGALQNHLAESWLDQAAAFDVTLAAEDPLRPALQWGGLEPAAAQPLREALSLRMEQSSGAALWKEARERYGATPEQLWVQGRGLQAFSEACGVVPRGEEIARWSLERAAAEPQAFQTHPVAQGLAALSLQDWASKGYDHMQGIQKHAASWVLRSAEKRAWLTAEEVEQTEVSLDHHLRDLNGLVRWIGRRWMAGAQQLQSKLQEGALTLGSLASRALTQRWGRDSSLGSAAGRLDEWLQLQQDSVSSKKLAWSTTDGEAPGQGRAHWRQWSRSAWNHFQQLRSISQRAWGRWLLQRAGAPVEPSAPLPPPPFSDLK